MLARFKDLAGISVEASVSCGKARFDEALLFTHRGLSGPAILQISSYWRAGQQIAVDLLTDLDAASFLKERKRARPKAELSTVLGEVMPQRLAQVLADQGVIGERRDKDLEALAATLKSWRVIP